jgi:Leucine-rich repeat (LRR) protein
MSSETLGNIKTLELIDMTDCTKIEVLPRQVAHQRYLSELCLTGTNIRELPSAIGDLRDLKILHIGGPSLEMLPPWLGYLKSLKELGIGDRVMIAKDCGIMERSSSNQLKCLPDSIGELNQLEKLSLNRTGVNRLPPCIMALNNLQELVVFDSPLVQLPFERDSLVECMLGLTFLSLKSTWIWEIAFGKGMCPNLQRLHIIYCKDLAEVGTLPNTLTELVFYDCETLQNIEGLSGLANLSYLEITRCPYVEELSGFGTLKSLHNLWLSGCEGITGIRGLQQLTKLRDLSVLNCCVLEELAGIEHLIGLRELYVSHCPKMHWGEEVLKHLRQRKEEGLLHLQIRDEEGGLLHLQ